jgi:AraC-like DNA-binding protein
MIAVYYPIQIMDHRQLDHRLSYAERLPRDELKPFVACYWTLKSKIPLQEQFPHRVLPDGCVDILFDFSSGETHVVGIMNKADIVPLTGDVHLMGIRLLPNSIPVILKGEAHFLVNHMLRLDEVMGKEMAFQEQIHMGTHSNDRLKIIEEWLIRIFKPCDSNLKWSGMLNLITERKGLISMPELAEYFTVSERHATRKFKSLFGLTTKEFISIIRFQSVLRNLKDSKLPIIWSEISLEGGYYDQSHFIHEFKKRYGMTPGNVFAG